MALRHVSILKGHPVVTFVVPCVGLCSTHGTTKVTKHTCYSIAATTPVLTIEILNSVF